MRDNEPGSPATGVAALDRAIAILNAFTTEDRSLTLAEISSRTGLYKSTILRLAASLMRADMLERLEDGRYRVGPALFRLGALYQRSLVVGDVLLPVMRELAILSGESVAFYVPSGETRTCLYRIESSHAIRYMIREGDVLPLGIGSGGRVLSAFGGAEGEPNATIRRAFVHVSLGERDPETSGISVPVFGTGQTLRGALTIAGPRNRVDAAFLSRVKGPLLSASARATRALGGDPAPLEAAASVLG